MNVIAVSIGPIDQTWYGAGLFAMITGFLLVLIGYGAQRLASDTKLFKFCGSIGAIALVLGFAMMGFASIAPHY